MIKGLLDQPDLRAPVFMPTVNLYYGADLSSDSGSSSASNGGCYTAERGQTRSLCHTHTHARTTCYEAGSKQMPVSIALFLRSVKLNDLLLPLGLSNKLQH